MEEPGLGALCLLMGRASTGGAVWAHLVHQLDMWGGFSALAAASVCQTSWGHNLPVRILSVLRWTHLADCDTSHTV